MSIIKKIKWQLHNLVLLAVALFHMARFGVRRRVPTHPKTVAIIQGAKLGDMVCTTPLFRAIKRKYPDARLIVVGDAVNQRLLAGHPAIARYIVWDKDFLKVVRALKTEAVDYGVVALPSLESLALLIVGGARAIVAPMVMGGLSPYETVSYRFVRRFVIAVPHYFGGYVPREYLRLLEPIGIKSADTKKWLVYSDTASAVVERFYALEKLNPKRDFIVGMTPAVGGNPRKRWAPEKFAAVADYLAQRYDARIIIIGAGRDSADIETMLRAVHPPTRAIDTLNRFSVEELKALIASFSLFISADTGPIYIAEAFNVPTIDIVGPMDENAQPPRGILHQVVVPPRERAAFGILNHDGSNKHEEFIQGTATTVEMVRKVIDGFVPKIISLQPRNTRL